MKRQKFKRIPFDDEMLNHFSLIKESLRKETKKKSSDRDCIKTLMALHKQSNVTIKRKPRKKKEIIFVKNDK